jgi:uncharacterized protein YjbJ (UPF0337 family)
MDRIKRLGTQRAIARPDQPPIGGRKDTPMNIDQLKGKWEQVKGEAKVQWGKLTDDDLDQVSGNAQKLAGRIQERYGYEKERAEREVDDFLRSQRV